MTAAPDPAGTFAAIDFETADYGADSACALAVVRVEGTRITERASFMIRPPRSRFAFTYIHGITWTDVAGEPSFFEHWPEIRLRLEGVDFLAAHNARFDRNVLRTCVAAAGLKMPRYKFLCTVQLARHAWSLRPANLPAVCRRLEIPLKHHDACSDAEACARIVIAARQQGIVLPRYLREPRLSPA
jgi:DNA polymerase-3 subunit epsilon